MDHTTRPEHDGPCQPQPNNHQDMVSNWVLSDVRVSIMYLTADFNQIEKMMAQSNKYFGKVGIKSDVF
jgi:hypothetical protein